MNAIFPELPTTLGIYDLTRQLGAYEDSELYLAAQSYVDRMVVLEVLRPDSPPEVEEAFREAVRYRTAATLPHVSPVLDSGQTDHVRYLIQEQPVGQPLPDYVAESGGLSTEQAFGLVQAVAELYCACRDQGMAARAISAETIYTDGEQYYFFSPVIAGEMTDEQRAAQMEALADTLERCMAAEAISASNIAVIIHWLRNGYGGAPLQWRPLAASLDTLRRRRMKSKQNLVQTLRAALTNKRHLRQVLKPVAIYAGIVVGSLSIILVLGALGAGYKWTPEPNLPAVDEKYVHCHTEADDTVRVLAQPVSIADYAAFLQALAEMSADERAELHRDLPSADHEPADWQAQLSAATAEQVWRGEKMSMETAVRGVSYADVLVYARYAGGEPANATLAYTARRHAGAPPVEEWTSTEMPAQFPHEAYRIVLPAEGDTLVREPDDTARNPQRGFRIQFTH